MTRTRNRGGSAGDNLPITASLKQPQNEPRNGRSQKRGVPSILPSVSKLALVGACVVIGFRTALRYGWMAGNTHWHVERTKARDKDLLKRLRESGY